MTYVESAGRKKYNNKSVKMKGRIGHLRASEYGGLNYIYIHKLVGTVAINS